MAFLIFDKYCAATLSYVFNKSLSSMQFYSASFTDDLRQVVDHVSARYPKSKIYAVGWSLGANILVRFLGQVYILFRNRNLASTLLDFLFLV